MNKYIFFLLELLYLCLIIYKYYIHSMTLKKEGGFKRVLGFCSNFRYKFQVSQIL